MVPSVDIFSFIFGLIVFYTVLTVGAIVIGARFTYKGARRLAGWVRERKLLPSARRDRGQAPPIPARDVVVESVDAQPAPVVTERKVYERLDVESGATAKDVLRVLASYEDDTVVGPHAVTVAETLRSANLRQQSLFVELGETFQKGSMSWDKFAAPAYAAFDAILRNSMVLANRIQAFDSAGYLRLKQQVANGDDNIQHGARAKRLEVFDQTLAAMEQMEEADESLLLELDKLASELVIISSVDNTENGDQIIDEIRRLVEEAKYYR